MREMIGAVAEVTRVYNEVIVPILTSFAATEEDADEIKDLVIMAENETGDQAVIMWNEEDLVEHTQELMTLEIVLKFMVESGKLDGFKFELNEHLLEVLDENTFSINVRKLNDIQTIVTDVFGINGVGEERLVSVKMPVSLKHSGFYEYMVIGFGISDIERNKLTKSLAVAGFGKKVKKFVEANRTVADQATKIVMRDVVSPLTGIIGDAAGNIGVGVMNAATEGVVSATNKFFEGFEVGNILGDGRVARTRANAKRAGAQIMNAFRKGDNENRTSFGTF